MSKVGIIGHFGGRKNFWMDKQLKQKHFIKN